MKEKIDLIDICNAHNLTFPKDALQAHYHKRNRLNLLRELIEEHLTRIPNRLDTRYLETVSIYIECSIIQAYAQTDIFAEIINVIVFNKSIRTRDVTFYKIKETLSENDILQTKLKDKMIEISDLSIYNYLNEFVNYIKHRGITIPQLSIASNEKPDYIIKGFTTSKGNTLSDIKWRDLFEMYDQLFSELLNLGNIIIGHYS